MFILAVILNRYMNVKIYVPLSILYIFYLVRQSVGNDMTAFGFFWFATENLNYSIYHVHLSVCFPVLNLLMTKPYEAMANQSINQWG